MCGICGYVDFSGRPLPLERLACMTDAMARRGPDGRGEKVFPGRPFAALGHRRLAVLDLSAAGCQPMSNEDGSLWLTFNGEIYNHRSLRRELEDLGHSFVSRTDSEVILHAFEQWEEDCLARLHGMFAFGLWNDRRKRLLLARDRLGEKPLLYAAWDGGLAFASEMTALLEAGLPVPIDIDPQAVSGYFSFMAVPEPDTILGAMKKLPPAHVLAFEGGTAAPRRYWELPPFRPVPGCGDESYLEELDALLARLTAERLVADVPVGAFLSGGIDSGIVAGHMAAASASPPRTFHVRFDAPGFDESAAAAEAARILKTRHTLIEARADIVDSLPELARVLDEPFGVASAAPMYFMSRAAREHVTVALTGDGGDELFAGYERYRWDKLIRPLSVLPWSLSQWTPGDPAFLDRPGCVRKALKLASAAALGPDGGFVSLITRFSEAEKHALFTSDFTATLAQVASTRGPEEPFARRYASYPGGDALGRRLYGDLGLSLPGEMLVKADRCGMAVGLELRTPLTDHRLSEFASRLPSRLKIGLFSGKVILRRHARKFFSPRHAARPKTGFSVPLDLWLGGDLRQFSRDMLLDPNARSRPYLDRRALAHMLDRHTAGAGNRGERIWICLMFEMWLRGATFSPRRQVSMVFTN